MTHAQTKPWSDEQGRGGAEYHRIQCPYRPTRALRHKIRQRSVLRRVLPPHLAGLVLAFPPPPQIDPDRIDAPSSPAALEAVFFPRPLVDVSLRDPRSGDADRRGDTGRVRPRSSAHGQHPEPTALLLSKNKSSSCFCSFVFSSPLAASHWAVSGSLAHLQQEVAIDVGRPFTDQGSIRRKGGGGRGELR